MLVNNRHDDTQSSKNSSRRISKTGQPELQSEAPAAVQTLREDDNVGF